MGRRRKQDDESIGYAILLLLGIAAAFYLWGSYGNIVFVVIGIIVALVIAGIAFNVIEEEKRVRALKLADIDNMDGIEFEHYVGKLLTHRGFQVEVTKASGDFGVDVIAQKSELKYAVQVKRYSKPVSRRAVSDAVAGKEHFGCNAAMVVTNNYFTDGAIELAQSTGCELINRDTLAKWILDFQTRKTATKLKDEQSFDKKLNQLARIDDNKSSAEMSKFKTGLHTESVTRPWPSFTSGQWLILALLGAAAISVFGCLIGLLVLR